MCPYLLTSRARLEPFRLAWTFVHSYTQPFISTTSCDIKPCMLHHAHLLLDLVLSPCDMSHNIATCQCPLPCPPVLHTAYKLPCHKRYPLLK